MINLCIYSHQDRASLVAQDGRVLLQCRRPGVSPWVRKIPWRREWQPTPVFLPGGSHGQTSLVGYSPWGCKELDKTEQLTHTRKHTHTQQNIPSKLEIWKCEVFLRWNQLICVFFFLMPAKEKVWVPGGTCRYHCGIPQSYFFPLWLKSVEIISRLWPITFSFLPLSLMVKVF